MSELTSPSQNKNRKSQTESTTLAIVAEGSVTPSRVDAMNAANASGHKIAAVQFSSESNDSSDEEGEEKPAVAKELEPGEYERKREAYWARILFCERKFYQELKPSYSKLRMRQLERSQNDIVNQTSTLYHERRSQLDKEFENKREQMRIRKDLRLLSTDRILHAEKKCASINRDNSEHLLAVKAREVEKARVDRARELERLTGGALRLSEAKEGRAESVNRSSWGLQSSGVDEVENKPKWEEGDLQGTERYRRRKEASPGNEAEYYWHDVPVMIAQLPKHEIRSDLELIASGGS